MRPYMSPYMSGIFRPCTQLPPNGDIPAPWACKHAHIKHDQIKHPLIGSRAFSTTVGQNSTRSRYSRVARTNDARRSFALQLASPRDCRGFKHNRSTWPMRPLSLKLLNSRIPDRLRLWRLAEPKFMFGSVFARPTETSYTRGSARSECTGGGSAMWTYAQGDRYHGCYLKVHCSLQAQLSQNIVQMTL
jgi:hypothetical protein